METVSSALPSRRDLMRELDHGQTMEETCGTDLRLKVVVSAAGITVLALTHQMEAATELLVRTGFQAHQVTEVCLLGCCAHLDRDA
jgi:homoserine kinase